MATIKKNNTMQQPTQSDDEVRISDIVDDPQTYDGEEIRVMNQPGHDTIPAPMTGKDNYRIYTKNNGISEDSPNQDAGTPGMIGGDPD